MALTIIFMIVIVTLYPIGRYSGVTLPVSTLIALAVCLIPTTIGALLSAIGIAGMDRVTRFNVIAMSGKAVEACGDVDTMILDKTGTIAYYGNRMAADFIPVSGVSVEELHQVCGPLLPERRHPRGQERGCPGQGAGRRGGREQPEGCRVHRVHRQDPHERRGSA